MAPTRQAAAEVRVSQQVHQAAPDARLLLLLDLRWHKQQGRGRREVGSRQGWWWDGGAHFQPHTRRGPAHCWDAAVLDPTHAVCVRLPTTPGRPYDIGLQSQAR